MGLYLVSIEVGVGCSCISRVAGAVGNSDVPNGRRSLSLEMDDIHRDRGVGREWIMLGSVRRYMVALLRPLPLLPRHLH